MNSIEYGPYPLRITNGLDFYKPTMSQLAYEKMLQTCVTFTFKNRGKQRIADFVDPKLLKERLLAIQRQGFVKDELKYLQLIKNNNRSDLFSTDYLNFLAHSDIPAINIEYDDKIDDIAISATGQWPLVTFWETIVMSEVNEAYFENYMIALNINPLKVYEEGDERLTNKINLLRQNPGIKFSDFGTRRHFSFRWQKHVLERLMSECPDNFLGTSNVGLANSLELAPIGTFAHEMPMVYAAVADKNNQNIRNSHGQMLDDWYERYGNKLSIALTDTFSSDFFFSDFGRRRAKLWNGLRHDSGSAIKFGEQAIEFYQQNDIDPLSKTIVFSDGLSINEINDLYNHFKGRIKTAFGWGTTLTNDLGIEPLNIVMKATDADGAETVKISDSPGKYTGNKNDIERYKDVFSRIG